MNSKPTEEIKQIRHELGRQAEFSVHRIFADLRNPRQSSERKYINAVATGTTKNAANNSVNNSVNRSGESGGN
jgi:signal recognition particle subunit SEC65